MSDKKRRPRTLSKTDRVDPHLDLQVPDQSKGTKRVRPHKPIRRKRNRVSGEHGSSQKTTLKEGERCERGGRGETRRKDGNEDVDVYVVKTWGRKDTDDTPQRV